MTQVPSTPGAFFYCYCESPGAFKSPMVRHPQAWISCHWSLANPATGGHSIKSESDFFFKLGLNYLFWSNLFHLLRCCCCWALLRYTWYKTLYQFKEYNRRRQWHLTPVLLLGKSHGRRSLEGCSPWSHWGSDTTKRLHFHFSLSCIGEGNGNPLQCSCLENPRDGGAWWAAVYGVTQSQTRLKWLSSSSSSICK